MVSRLQETHKDRGDLVQAVKIRANTNTYVIGMYVSPKTSE